MPQYPLGCATFPECFTPTKSHATPLQAKEPASRLRFSISINSKWDLEGMRRLTL